MHSTLPCFCLVSALILLQYQTSHQKKNKKNVKQALKTLHTPQHFQDSNKLHAQQFIVTACNVAHLPSTKSNLHSARATYVCTVQGLHSKPTGLRKELFENACFHF